MKKLLHKHLILHVGVESVLLVKRFLYLITKKNIFSGSPRQSFLWLLWVEILQGRPSPLNLLFYCV